MFNSSRRFTPRTFAAVLAAEKSRTLWSFVIPSVEIIDQWYVADYRRYRSGARFNKDFAAACRYVKIKDNDGRPDEVLVMQNA